MAATLQASLQRSMSMDSRIDAAYVRQSVDRKDSISIESQLEFCRRELIGGSFKEYADPVLGGINFDQKIVALIVADLEEQGCEIDVEDDALAAEIREKAEKTKIQLTNVEQVNNIIFTIGGKTYRTKITRARFEEAAKPLLDRTRLFLDELLETASLSWRDIDHLLLVGGSTKMPMVKRMLEEMSGKSLTYKVNPDTAVAVGAAMFAATLGNEAGADGGAAAGAGAGGAAAGGAGAGGAADADARRAAWMAETRAVYTGSAAAAGAAGSAAVSGRLASISVSDVTSQSLGVISPGRQALCRRDYDFSERIR
jgi:hypothetical protein